MSKIPPSWTARILAEVRRSDYIPLRDKSLARRLDIPLTEFGEFRELLKDLVNAGRIASGPRGTILAAHKAPKKNNSSAEAPKSPLDEVPFESGEAVVHEVSGATEAPNGAKKGKKIKTLIPEPPKDLEIPTPASGKKKKTKDSPAAKTPSRGDIVGIFRRSAAGACWVRPEPQPGIDMPDVRIFEEDALDAAGGDRVLVRRISRDSRSDRRGRRSPPPRAIVVRILDRSRSTFVGTYFEPESANGAKGFVRVDGRLLGRSIEVADAATRHPLPGDRVVIEIVKYPTADQRGEGVITEVLGKWGDPGVDMLSVIRANGLPDHFPEEALEEARKAAQNFDEKNFDGREDFTQDRIITIDPVDAKDFDDAVDVRTRPTGGFDIAVHIADVGHFAPVGGELDQEARRRATSVYLPGLVIPMFPEIISNHLASLQEGKNRYVQSVIFSIDKSGRILQSRLAKGVICVTKRLAYEQAQEILEGKGSQGEEIDQLVKRAREAAGILNRQRIRRGALELELGEAHLDLDAQGKVTGAHWRKHDWSHRLIEELMLAANEVVAQKLDDMNVAYLHRNHPAPDPEKLRSFGRFAKSLGHKSPASPERRDLQELLDLTRQAPDRHAIHFGLLRSLKQAVYSPQADEHFALATRHYCHFTSPIRRYPDLVVHRLVDKITRTGAAKSDITELESLGFHCSRMERRAEQAERELVKSRLLDWMAGQVGMEFSARIAGVAEYGFFAQGETIPVEGLVHVKTLGFGRYHLDEETQTLAGPGKSYRLGDQITVKVVHVEPMRGQLDLEVVRRK